MDKILIATEKPFAPVAVKGIREIIEAAGFELCLLEKYAEKKQLLEAVADATALIIRSDKIDNEVMQAAPKLKIVVRAGAGYDNVDLAAATEHKIVVMNTPGQNSNAVAELVIGLLLFNYRNRFNGKSGRELKGKSIGLFAYGHVAQCVAHLAEAFGMKIYAFDTVAIKDPKVTAVKTPAELFENCDIVSLHIPLNKYTEKAVNADLVGRMHQGGILINTARKEVIHEDELLATLKERTDLSYITDIMPAQDAAFAEALGDRYFSTPKKMGAQTAEANINAGLAAAHQIVGFLKEGNCTFQVNK